VKNLSDPIGVLNEGEIFFRSSQQLLHPETCTLFNVVTGDVLVCHFMLISQIFFTYITIHFSLGGLCWLISWLVRIANAFHRYPMRLPSDIQRVNIIKKAYVSACAEYLVL
jgi:hypothetical protein